MSRCSLVLTLAVVLATFAAAPAYGQPALESGVSLETLLLRVEGDDNWKEEVNPTGTPAAMEIIQMAGGTPQLPLNPVTAEAYALHQVQDVYVHRNVLDNVFYEPVGTFVETRIFTFLNETDAAAYLSDAYDNHAEAASAASLELQLAPVSPLPAFDTPIVGWTQVDTYVDGSTNEFFGYASSVRYMSQVGRAIVSVQVTGPFVDFNFDLAHALLGLQTDCLMSESVCEPVTFQTAIDTWKMSADGVLSFTASSSVTTPARWVWPVQEPVREPDMSGSLN